MLKIFMAVCLLPSANDDEFNISHSTLIKIHNSSFDALPVTKIRITSRRTVFLKYGEVGFSKAGITSNFHEIFIYLIFF